MSKPSYLYPAGQTPDAVSTAPKPPDGSPAPAPTAAPDIAVAPDGSVRGIDGMLDQISRSLLRQARVEILPAIQQDRELQRTVGSAIGKELATPLWIMAGAVVIYVGWKMLRAESPS